MRLFFAVLCLCALAFTQEQATSVADAAKKARESKPGVAKKVYTNENLPTTGGGVNVVGAEAKSLQPLPTPTGDSVADQATLDVLWHQAIVEQKARIDDLEGQLDVAEQNQARSAHLYPIGGNPRYERIQSQIDNLKQQIENEKKRLAELQDEAHKAGANKAYD